MQQKNVRIKHPTSQKNKKISIHAPISIGGSSTYYTFMLTANTADAPIVLRNNIVGMLILTYFDMA